MVISEVAEKIKNEMAERGLIERLCSKEHDDLIVFYISMAYSIGYDEGRKQGSHRRMVAQFDMHGNFIKNYGSLTVAARKVKRTKGAIQKCCAGLSEHCAGYKWKYVIEKDGTTEDNS